MKGITRVVLTLWCLAMIFTAAFAAGEETGPQPVSIHLPAVETDSETPTGQHTTWSCVYFGRYPFAEVVDSGWAAVDSYALREGDVIRDDGLYARLETAEWQDDRTELDGESYLRVGLDQAPADGSTEQHYLWDYSRPWHYFRVMPIRWRVLDIRDNRALLLADRMPDSIPFHTEDEDVTWQTSTLRSWLNGYGAQENRRGEDYAGRGFLDRAFTPEEQAAVLPVACENLANRSYGTSSGPDTEDRIFILSNAEVFEGENAGRYGFDPGRSYDDPAKRFTSTLYAKCMGAWWSPVEAYQGNSFWFMRTSGYTPRSTTYVCDFGYIYSKGTLVTCGDAGVLPALWIDLDKADIRDAGETVSADIMRKTERAEMSFPVPDIGNPVIVPDETAPGGTRTIWSMVAFGQYPQQEIPTDGSIAAEDAELVRMLKAADEAGKTEAEADGLRYVNREGRWFRYEPICWRVLEVSDGTALLMADKCLDSVPYHGEYREVFWEKSDVRKWLNGQAGYPETLYGLSFPDLAFTDTEKQALTTAAVPNAANYYFGTACGSGTRDRVFLLAEEDVFSSEAAVRYGFQPNDAVSDMGRRLLPTEYALARGGWQCETGENAGKSFWILRTNGYTPANVVYVGENGCLYNRGIMVTCADAGIVPVIRIRLGAAPCARVE